MSGSGLFFAMESKPKGTRLPCAELLAQLRFNEQGLIAVIAQDVNTKAVLMMAWMNRQALDITLKEGRVCYWSRSRKTLWRKGETSGNQQQLRSLRVDCDGDAILCEVEQTGPACHTGRPNCFYWRVDGEFAEIMTAPVEA